MPFSENDAASPNLAEIVATERQSFAAGGPVNAPPRRRLRLAWYNARAPLVALACALVLVNIALALIVVRGLQDTYADVQTTQDTLTAIYHLDADIREMSRAHHEFLLTGLSQFADAYHAVAKQVPQEAARIRALTAASQDQQRRMDVVEQRLADDGSAMDAVAALNPSGPDPGLLRELLGREGLYDTVRNVLDDMQQDERVLQAGRVAAVQERTDQALAVSVLRTIFGVALLGLLFHLIRRDRLARRALVAEQTTALASAADALNRAAGERRQIEMALRDREMKLRGLSDAVPQIVFVAYRDGSAEFTNRRWHDYTGAAATLSQGREWSQLVHPEDVGRMRLRWQQATRHAAPFVTEYRLRGKNGGYRWFLAQAVPVAEQEGGDVVHWVGTLTDIDDIRRADAALRESEQRFRRIFEGSPFGITLSEGEDRRVLQANPAFCQMLGYEPDELIGRSLVDVTHPDERPAQRAFPRLEGAGPGWRQREKRYLTKQGAVVWARIRVAVFDPLGGSGQQQLLAVVEDISRQRDADEALRQAQRMEAVGQLSGGLAHDFNNLLGVIIGNIECLLDTMTDDPDRSDMAREVLDSALGGAELTRRLLAFGRRQALSPQSIDLSTQVARHVNLLARTLGPKIRVETLFADDLWLTRADPSQLGDALLNLAINARDAMPHGGVLTIETHNDRVWDEDAAHEPDLSPGDYVVLAVSDTGIGMPPEVSARAIEPFFTTKGPGVGSGLGLSMIYGFVRQSGGYLKINSEVGIGTTVRICLPRATGEQDGPAVSAAPRMTLPTGNETILVVDDSPEMRQVAERHLRFLGYSVLTAEHGPAALALLRAGAPVDLLFTDIAMPEGLDGFQLADAARQLRPGLKVVFTTGYAGTQDPAGTPDWQDRLIRKPYRRPDLAERIRTALS